MTVLTTRVLMNGDSQAVRIPQEFRLDTREVQITRAENGDLVLHPVPEARGTALLEVMQGIREALGDGVLDEMVEELRHHSL